MVILQVKPADCLGVLGLFQLSVYLETHCSLYFLKNELITQQKNWLNWLPQMMSNVHKLDSLST